MSNEQATGLSKAVEADHLLEAARKRVQQSIGTAAGHRETLAGLRARLLGEHVDGVVDDEAPTPVRAAVEELNYQITVLQEQQDLIGAHIDSLMQL